MSLKGTGEQKKINRDLENKSLIYVRNSKTSHLENFVFEKKKNEKKKLTPESNVFNTTD